MGWAEPAQNCTADPAESHDVGLSKLHPPNDSADGELICSTRVALFVPPLSSTLASSRALVAHSTSACNAEPSGGAMGWRMYAASVDTNVSASTQEHLEPDCVEQSHVPLLVKPRSRKLLLRATRFGEQLWLMAQATRHALSTEGCMGST